MSEQFPIVSPSETLSPDLPVLTHLAFIHEERFGDEEMYSRLDIQISRGKILSYDSDDRQQFVLNGVLEALNISEDIQKLFSPDNERTIEERRCDAEHTLSIERKAQTAQEWYDMQIAECGRIETGEKLLVIREMVNQLWAETDFFRAFEHLRDRTKSNPTDQQAKAIILAHRQAIIMMAQASEEYTKERGNK